MKKSEKNREWNFEIDLFLERNATFWGGAHELVNYVEIQFSIQPYKIFRIILTNHEIYRIRIISKKQIKNIRNKETQ